MAVGMRVQPHVTRSGTYEIDAAALEAAREPHRRVLDTLAELLSRPQYQPPLLPHVAQKVVASSRRPDLAAQEVAALASQCPNLAGGLLKVAGSAALGATAPVRTLKDAVVRLGAAGVRQVVWELAFDLRIFRAPEFAPRLEQARQHCRAVAIVARHACRYAPLDGEHAFLCGLLHDAGLAAMLVAEAELARSGTPLPASGLDQRLLRGREEASQLVAARWNAPPEVKLVLELQHHHAGKAPQHPVVAVLRIADELAARAGASALPNGPNGAPPDHPSAADVTAARLALGLSERSYALLATESAELVKRCLAEP